MERAMGIEPTSEAWEASILPLYDARLFPILRHYTQQPMRPYRRDSLSRTQNYSRPFWGFNSDLHPASWTCLRECHLFSFALQFVHGYFAAAFTLDGIAGRHDSHCCRQHGSRIFSQIARPERVFAPRTA